tara:strand:+ start:38765 stop:39184 length:420 start_codon:yes stop_codon:yes gene_type:complete
VVIFNILSKNNIMKQILKIAILLFTTALFAQYPDTVHGTEKTRKMSQEITKAYDAQLGLSGRQLPIFQNKVEDYLILSEKVKDTYEGRAELDALTELAVKETLEMNDVLTRIQYKMYKKVRQDIQPIKRVKPKVEQKEK